MSKNNPKAIVFEYTFQGQVKCGIIPYYTGSQEDWAFICSESSFSFYPLKKYKNQVFDPRHISIFPKDCPKSLFYSLFPSSAAIDRVVLIKIYESYKNNPNVRMDKYLNQVLF